MSPASKVDELGPRSKSSHLHSFAIEHFIDPDYVYIYIY